MSTDTTSEDRDATVAPPDRLETAPHALAGDEVARAFEVERDRGL